jgi:hypothetical protein
VRDHENATGEKSCERIAIEKAAPILANAKSWEQAHKALNSVGVRYELRGSGALLWVNDQPVKASVIGREFSRKRMEERLGVFQPTTRSLLTKHSPRQAESIGRDDSGRWTEYRKVLGSPREGRKQHRLSSGSSITKGVRLSSPCFGKSVMNSTGTEDGQGRLSMWPEA